MEKETDMNQKIEQLRSSWENEEFQKKHAKARNLVIRTLRELNGFYIAKTGYGFTRFVESRMKTPESICGKLQRKGRPVDFKTATEVLNDISGVRCICYSVKEIYWIAHQIGKDSRFQIIKAKDYIRKPKKNGYESYHIIMDVPVPTDEKKEKVQTVRVELQLRTMIMDAWASMDNRISYKKDDKISPEMMKRIEKYAKIGRRLDKLIQRTLDEVVEQ